MNTILVIEDDDVTRSNISENLFYNGYKTFEAKDGKEGIDMIHAEQPDLVICDINMPMMNGYEVLEWVRNNSRTVHIPFIFLTANTDSASLRTGMSLGADDYIPKPFENHDLLRAVELRIKKQKKLVETYETKLKELRMSLAMAIPHELRTPLVSVIGYAELMRMDAEVIQPAEIEMMSNSILKAGWRLQRLIENYLMYLRVEAFQDNPELLGSSSVVLLDDALLRLQAIAISLSEHYHIPIHVAHLQQEFAIKMTEEHFHKILTELLDNACKFAIKDTSVNVQVDIVNQHMRIQITNYGRGMTEEQINSIGAYMQFERLIHEQQGLGLGMIIAKRLVELYQGQFSIQSILHDSTTVTIMLPLA
jgi:two-component system, sensor histidine kinase and response regulator